MATGVYTGDGAATQAIVGVGFRPRMVWICYQGEQVAPADGISMGFKTDQDGLFAAFYRTGGAGGCKYDNDTIISLDADGFTVGDSSAFFTKYFNTLGWDYTYIAWS